MHFIILEELCMPAIVASDQRLLLRAIDAYGGPTQTSRSLALKDSSLLFWFILTASFIASKQRLNV